jgi:phage I-like protein
MPGPVHGPGMNSRLITPDIAVALCASQHSDALEVAICFGAELVVTDGQAPQWVQLLPVGEITPVDGREPWTCNNPDAVIAASQSRLARMQTDYDHGSDTSGSSRAAGWIKELKASGPNGEPGIWARMDWTEAGGKAVASKEYRFLSPVFNFRKDTRQVTDILRAALTNNPALVMTALASAQPIIPPTKENMVDLTKLLKLLGLPDTATEADATAAIEAMCQDASAMASTKKGVCSILAAAGLTADIAKFDDTVATAICTKLKVAGESDTATLSADLTTAQLRILELVGNAETKTAEQRIEAALASQQITPAQKTDALALCKRDPAAFDAFIAKAVPVLTPGKVTPSKKVGADNGLSEEEAAVCSSLDIKPEDYKATAKAMGYEE